MKPSHQTVGTCQNCATLIALLEDANMLVSQLRCSNQHMKLQFVTYKTQISRLKDAAKSRRMKKTLRGHDPKNAVQADMIASAVSRAIEGDS